MKKTTFTILSFLEIGDRPDLEEATGGVCSPNSRTAFEDGREAVAIARAEEYGMEPIDRARDVAFSAVVEMSALIERFDKRRDREKSTYWSVFSEIQQTTL